MEEGLPLQDRDRHPQDVVEEERQMHRPLQNHLGHQGLDLQVPLDKPQG